jgi:V/A-type H+-transporting ATPase subunit A
MGRIKRISGPLVIAEDVRGVSVYELIEVGEQRLVGEVIGVQGDDAVIQVYEDTTGLRVGEPVYPTGNPLVAELGPGLIGSIFDGIQRPLPEIGLLTGIMLSKGVKEPPLPRNKKWTFKPLVKHGDEVSEGDFIGVIEETKRVKHYIMVPPGVKGKVNYIAPEGDYTIIDTIATIGNTDLKMLQKWPVRKPRPYLEKHDVSEPLITGQRVIDFLFPLGKGGKAAIPGGFGTGKTVTLQTITKWSEADVSIYIGCGERGNEMADALHSLKKLVDPKTGRPLMEKSIFIANTSNMPVAAREASIFLGITMAEYYRDMGYNVLLVADSTSRWAEAMREISGRLEELPGEEGFPAYLSSRLASFYERSGYVTTLGKPLRKGSVTIVGAVSPPGADFSEPVTQATLRIIRALYALDVNLAYRRHYPAINWLISYSLYVESVKMWWENMTSDYSIIRNKLLEILQKEAELEELVRLVGVEALPEEDKLVLETARIIREDFLMQDAFHPVDAFTSPRKAYKMAKAIIEFHEKSLMAIRKGKDINAIRSLASKQKFAQMKRIPEDKFDEYYNDLLATMKKEFEELLGGEA